MRKTQASWFLIGVLLGAMIGVWGTFLLSVSADRADWRCTSYSPVTGQCVLMQHADYIPTPEDARD